jgi:hypothetical protein
MAKFAVGEIAVICNVKPPYDWSNGIEVTILEVTTWVDGDTVYIVDAPPEITRYNKFPASTVGMRERYLQKRPQPPDWLALIDKLPIEELA